VFVRVWEYDVPGDRAAAFTTAYESLDAQLDGLAAAERSLFEGSSWPIAPPALGGRRRRMVT
jgi:hypothetical protein